MSAGEALWWVIGSGTALLCLVGLFRIEAAAGKRLLPGFRRLLDQAIVGVGSLAARLGPKTGAGALRMTLLFLCNKLLRRLQAWFVRGTDALVRLQERNRQAARHISQARQDNHLAAMQAHKQETLLTPKERERRKRRSLEG